MNYVYIYIDTLIVHHSTPHAFILDTYSEPVVCIFAHTHFNQHIFHDHDVVSAARCQSVTVDTTPYELTQHPKRYNLREELVTQQYTLRGYWRCTFENRELMQTVCRTKFVALALRTYEHRDASDNEDEAFFMEKIHTMSLVIRQLNIDRVDLVLT